MLKATYTWGNTTTSRRHRDKTKNHGRLGGIRQTPLQKQPCHLPEETGVQLLCAASYDIWCRELDTDQTRTEQTCGRADQNGKKYAQHHIQGKKDQHLGQGEDKSRRRNQQCEKNELVLGRAHQLPQRRPMDLACHHLETIVTTIHSEQFKVSSLCTHVSFMSCLMSLHLSFVCGVHLLTCSHFYIFLDIDNNNLVGVCTT